MFDLINNYLGVSLVAVAFGLGALFWTWLFTKLGLLKTDVEGQEMTICPTCATALEDFDWIEGGYCPKCEDWCPPDLVRDFLEEQC